MLMGFNFAQILIILGSDSMGLIMTDFLMMSAIDVRCSRDTYGSKKMAMRQVCLP